VTGRAFGYPIMGTYEVVALALGLVIGCAMPYVSLNKQHVYMDFLVMGLSGRKKALLLTFTRLLNIGLFLLIGYPMAFLVGLCCLVQCIVYLIEIGMAWRAAHE
jgi:TRAP-type C4-dicarboxylate transport system permease small subunit